MKFKELKYNFFEYDFDADFLVISQVFPKSSALLYLCVGMLFYIVLH